MQEIEGSTPAPQTVANGRAPSDRPRTVPASLASRTPQCPLLRPPFHVEGPPMASRRRRAPAWPSPWRLPGCCATR